MHQGITQADKKQITGLVQALKKQQTERTPQQEQFIKRMLDCKDLDKQKQQQLLIFAQKHVADQSLSQAEKNQYSALIQALRKLPGQRNQQQKKLVSFALDCKQQGKSMSPVLPSTQQQKTRDLAQAGVPTPQNVTLLDFGLLRTTTPQGKIPDETLQIIQPTLEDSLVNKLLQIDQKYNLNLIEPFVGREDLGYQVLSVVQKDNAIKQYIQKFNPTNKQSQQQFPNIKQRLNQLLPDKKNNILIEKILQQSLNKQKRQKAALGPKFQPKGQLIDVFKLAAEKKDLVPGQKFKNIAQNITQVKKKARLTPSSSLQQPDAFQR
jgi:hypothetical protein